MANNLTNTYAAIVKQEKLEDGTLLVYGKATDDSLDIDQQICDAGWLDRAMPEWFKTGGNIREQHSNIAAGVAKEYEQKGDGHYISALVVDPVSVKKVETGVLKGFSIGIRQPRVVRDNKAVNGRIIDGQIVEISLVDRPANPNAKLMLAKSDNNSELVKVEEYSETDETPTEGENMEEKATEPAVGEKPSREDALRNLESARQKYKEIEAMCKELGYFDSDESKQYGETAEQETEEGPSVGAETAEEEAEEARGEKPLDKSEKCLECGCHQPANSHGSADVTTAEMVSPTETPKSTVIPEPTIEEIGTVIEEEDSESEEDSVKSAISDDVFSAIIAKAVKSATDSVVAEVEVLKSAIEAEKLTINKLQDELATAKTKAVSGGPKRTAAPKQDNASQAELLTIAAKYRNKAATATDQTLAKGYSELASDFEAKAAALLTK